MFWPLNQNTVTYTYVKYIPSIRVISSGFLHKTLFFSKMNTQRHIFYELSPCRKIGPKCWWVQSWNTPTFRPKFLLVNPETTLPLHRVFSSGLQHTFSKIWFLNMIAADLFCTMIVKWTRDVYTAIGTIISVLGYFLAIQCTNEDKILVPKVFYFHWYQSYQKQDWKWQNSDFKQI